MRRKFALHGAYMFRSYALTLSALTLRSYTFRGSECTIEWAKNKYFPGLKLIVQPPGQAPDSSGPAPLEMRGNGLRFIMGGDEGD